MPRRARVVFLLVKESVQHSRERADRFLLPHVGSLRERSLPDVTVVAETTPVVLLTVHDVNLIALYDN